MLDANLNIWSYCHIWLIFLLLPAEPVIKARGYIGPSEAVPYPGLHPETLCKFCTLFIDWCHAAEIYLLSHFCFGIWGSRDEDRDHLFCAFALCFVFVGYILILQQNSVVLHQCDLILKQTGRKPDDWVSFCNTVKQMRPPLWWAPNTGRWTLLCGI